MRRAAPVLAGLAGVGIVLPFFVGVGPRTILFVLPVFAALGVVALLGSRRTVSAEPGWTAPSRFVEAVSGGTRQVPSPRTRPAARRVAAALSRVEARELATSPWFGVGIGFLVISFLSFAVVWGAENGSPWVEVVALAPWLAHPLVGMVVLAAHRGVTRARRDGTDELFDTCPALPATRTWGSIGSAWVPVLALIAFFVVYGATTSVRSPNLYGSPGPDAIAMLVGALILGIGGVVLGVALGLWARFALAPVVAVVGIGFLSLKLATTGDPGWNPWQQLSTFPPISSETPPIFTDGPAWSHLGWVAALTGAVLVVAVARHRRDRTVAVLGAAACLLVAVTGVAATRPMPGSSAARIAGRIAHPADHQRCVPSGSVKVCVYAGNEELGERVVAEVEPVAAMLPDPMSPLTLRQGFPADVDDLPPEVARRLPDGVPPPPAGEVALGFSGSPDALRVPRYLVALNALGLPTQPGPDHRAVVIAGQARGVVALWLATRALGPGLIGDLTSGLTARDLGNRQPDAFDRGYAWPVDCGTPVVWSAQDLRAARSLAALPEAAVRAAMHQAWERWRDPGTGTNDLLAAVGLPPVGPFDAVQSRTQDPC